MYQPNYENIAHKIIHQTVNIAPGQQVVIETRADGLLFSELLAAEIIRSGASATIFMIGDTLTYHEMLDTPISHLPHANVTQQAAVIHTDVNIQVGLGYADPARFQNLPPERVQAYGARRTKYITARFEESKAKWLGIGYPSRPMSEALDVSWTEFFQLFWRAIDVDYAQLGNRAHALQDYFLQGDPVHVTSPAGTDLEFRRGDRALFLDDGRLQQFANLPAGELSFAPLEDSVEGRVVADTLFIPGGYVRGLELQFENGIAVPITAREGFERFMEFWESHDEGRKRLGEFAIGLNPECHQTTGYDLLDRKVMGAVSMTMGENMYIGGANRSTLRLEMIMLRPTIEIHGKRVLENGRFID